MRNWSLPTACAKQTPIPHADMRSLRGYCLSCRVASFHWLATHLPSVDDEMVQGIAPWTMSHAVPPATRAADLETGPVARYLRSPSRAIVVRYRSTSLLAKIRQQPAPLSHELEKTSPGVKVVLVGAQVIGKSVDPLGEESNLNFGRTGIIRMRAKLSDDRLFLLGLQRHICGSLSGKTRLQTQKNRALLSTQPAAV